MQHFSLSNLTETELMLLGRIVEDFKESTAAKGEAWSDTRRPGNHHASLKLNIPEMVDLETLKHKVHHAVAFRPKLAKAQ